MGSASLQPMPLAVAVVLLLLLLLLRMEMAEVQLPPAAARAHKYNNKWAKKKVLKQMWPRNEVPESLPVQPRLPAPFFLGAGPASRARCPLTVKGPYTAQPLFLSHACMCVCCFLVRLIHSRLTTYGAYAT